MGMTGGTAAGRRGRWRGDVWSECVWGGGGGLFGMRGLLNI